MISYVNNSKGISPEQLSGFFVDWPRPPSNGKFVELLDGSSHIVLALEAGKVVGFISEISDSVLRAYIPLLEVLPVHQGQGIGGELVRQMLEQLSGLYMIDLLYDEHLLTCYEKLGLRRATDAFIRNDDWQE